MKTHTGGLKQNTKSSENSPVDPLELFTYKILEYSGYGTETNFIYDDVQNFYICTKDVVSYSDIQTIKDYPNFLIDDKS